MFCGNAENKIVPAINGIASLYKDTVNFLPGDVHIGMDPREYIE